MITILKNNMPSLSKPFAVLLLLTAAISMNPQTPLWAGQGAVRQLYAVPNTTFIENPAGDAGVVTINDVSGSIATLQTSINNARSSNPGSIIVIHLLSGATYS